MYGLYGLKHHIVEISGDVTDKENLDILDISNKKKLTYIDNLDNLDLGPPSGGSRQRTL